MSDIYELALLAVLCNDLNLNAKRVEQLNLFYSNILEFVADKGSTFVITENINLKNNTFEINWRKKIQNYNWVNLEDKVQKLLIDLQYNNISLLSYSDFPESLIQLSDCPAILYYQGDIKNLYLKNIIAIVGSRLIAPYSIKMLIEVLNNLQHLEMGVVSGLAIGVDAKAHFLSLESDLACIAFVGSGLDFSSFFPFENYELKQRIIQNGGLVCSEYPPGFKSMPYTFPRRNRFIAKLASLVWIVQAGAKSGSLITAKLATDFGNTVGTVPADVFDVRFAGNLELLKDGAQIITTAEDIVTLMSISQTSTNLSQNSLERSSLTSNIVFPSQNSEKLYKMLGKNSMTIHELLTISDLNMAEINSELSILELYGLIEAGEKGEWSIT